MFALVQCVILVLRILRRRRGHSVPLAIQVHRTIRTRAYLSRAGHRKLDDALRQQAMLYNAALEERVCAYRQAGETISYSAQSRSLTQVRADFPDIEGALDRRVQVGTLQRLEKAFRAFFRRVTSGEAPGFPRFKSGRRWRTLEIYSGASGYVKYEADRGRGRVAIKGLPILRFCDDRLPEGVQPLEIRISRRPTGVYLYMVFDHLEAEPPVENPLRPLGLNAGRSSVRWGLSDGRHIERRRVDDNVYKRLQRRLARQKRGSGRRGKTLAQMQRWQERERVRNRNVLHRISAWLIKQYDHFVIEDLDIQQITKTGRGTVEKPGEEAAKKRTMNRSVLAQTWGEFAEMLTYKAEGAGMQVIRVNPAHTSVTCSKCGYVNEKASEAERNRIGFRCPSCGYRHRSRSVNAARVILDRGRAELAPGARESLGAGRSSNETISGAKAPERPENHVYSGLPHTGFT